MPAVSFQLSAVSQLEMLRAGRLVAEQADAAARADAARADVEAMILGTKPVR